MCSGLSKSMTNQIYLKNLGGGGWVAGKHKETHRFSKLTNFPSSWGTIPENRLVSILLNV